MSKISGDKKERIMGNIISILYDSFPKSLFTVEISRAEARDEEFVKSLLLSLENQGLVRAVKKNPSGVPYSRRTRWTLTTKAYNAYKSQSS
ncbi:hypothetical protein COU61_02455 [Candidatus Pacearchaeota archaeon CG10_big_fil_rev_8_21_14_0_10_35_13]|nr:MAG: hypothetical protein COU61_02455 [Candidatus Pacearchaeota archaeon CG10_big_fil_rev_8_21_14_0_10_35_13]